MNSMSDSGVRADLSGLFNPRGVAVVGASAGRTRIGAQALAALRSNGYKGRIYPINPKYPEIDGLECHKSLRDLPGPCDVAIISIGGEHVPALLHDCAHAGIGYAVIFSAGFSEIGARGAQAQAALEAAMRETGVRVVGPNCQGLMNLRDRLMCGFGSIFMNPALKPGELAMVSQSGGFGYGVLGHAQHAGIGFNYIVSAGNEADLNTLDFLEYFVEQDDVKVVSTYMEGVRDGARLRRIGARALELGKPILVWKVGNTDRGRRAAASHTANLTSDYEVYRTAFAEGAFIEITDVEDLIDIARAFGSRTLPKGRRAAIVTVSGGAGVLFADRCEERGLQLAELTPASLAELKSFLPEYASFDNPFDLTAQVLNDASHFNRAVRVIANDPHVDLVLMRAAQTLARGEQLNDLADVMRSTGKPVFLAWGAPPDRASIEIQALEAMHIPWHATPGRATFAAAALAKFAARLAEREHAEERVEPITKKIPIVTADATLDEHAAMQFLRLLGVPTVRELLMSAEEVQRLATLPYAAPLVLKANSPDLPHKTEAGGVRLNVQSLDELKSAATEMIQTVEARAPEAKLTGLLVQEQVSGAEVIVGVKNDAFFGPIVMLGLGGIFTEVLKDVSYRFAPFGESTARAMIGELRGAALLNGYRGRLRADIDALAKVLVAVSRIAAAYRDEIAEIDLNPVIVGAAGAGALVADALIVLKDGVGVPDMRAA